MNINMPFQPSGATGTTPNAQTTVAISTAVQQINLPAASNDANTMVVIVDQSVSVAWSYGVSSGLTLDNGVFLRGPTSAIFALPLGVTQLSVIGSAAVGNFRVVVGIGD